jgi:methylated-DNA-[protein]-cysteine S-methyltransferase
VDTLDRRFIVTVTTVLASPIGPLTLVAGAAGLSQIIFGDERPADETDAGGDAARILDQARQQLGEYFVGERRTFQLPLDPRGTPFQLAAWRLLGEIPYGETITYGEQARRLGRLGAARAVGAANGRNPLPIVVPCHRVVGANGRLVGFGGGLEAKRYLLNLEVSVRMRGGSR